jgi:NADPH:quinone reductase-like Zn-dependent oxidoreductase
MCRSGLRVVTTASPNHFDLVKSLGAEAVFDYHDPECGKKIREYTNNSLQYAFDAISVESSFKICEEAFPLGEESLQEDAAKKLHLVTQLPMTGWTRKDVDVQTILAYTTFGEAFSKFGTDFPPLDDHFKFGVMFWALAAKLLAEGKIKTHPVLLRPDGLQGVPAG